MYCLVYFKSWKKTTSFDKSKYQFGSSLDVWTIQESGFNTMQWHVFDAEILPFFFRWPTSQSDWQKNQGHDCPSCRWDIRDSGEQQAADVSTYLSIYLPIYMICICICISIYLSIWYVYIYMCPIQSYLILFYIILYYLHWSYPILHPKWSESYQFLSFVSMYLCIYVPMYLCICVILGIYVSRSICLSIDWRNEYASW